MGCLFGGIWIVLVIVFLLGSFFEWDCFSGMLLWSWMLMWLECGVMVYFCVVSVLCVVGVN